MEPNKKQKSTLEEENSTKLLNINPRLYAEPESYLQNLGFTVNNGKARFKLDEDAPLYCKAAAKNVCAVDEDDTSLSFVVLGKDSLDTIQQSSIASYVDIQQKCMSIDYNSMIASWDSVEVHKKLNEVLQENTKLKETLKQNNIAMKQQFNTLVTWQEDIMRIHQNHKKKFAETRELINYLKKENTDLKMRLSSELTSHSEMGYEFLDANDKQDTAREEKASILENQLSEQICRELDSILNENINKEKILKESGTSESIEKTAESETENADNKRFFEEERIALQKERENLEEEKKMLDSQKKTLEIEYKNLNSAKELLQQEKISLQEEQTSLDQQSQLYEIYHKKSLESEKEKFQTKYNQLIIEIGVMHESVQEKTACIKELQKELAQYVEDNTLLRTQLELYEEDFEQERKLREMLLQEKNSLNADLQKQIEFNERLQQQIESLTTSGSQPPLLSLSCPNCNRTFPNVHVLEIHVNDCLSLD
ncbi:NF-kappa-B essential modulator isoform X2 [Bombus terrestris]|uniref:NF-kappa-B essential modulator isoform X2 n=1 Tax=Bombus terrestris TaxID=30195 RepID=A0A9B7CYC9_BOMTE|nr:NF-kappa-B essential modulator isoform X2 [Bombus terrestris]